MRVGPRLGSGLGAAISASWWPHFGGGSCGFSMVQGVRPWGRGQQWRTSLSALLRDSQASGAGGGRASLAWFLSAGAGGEAKRLRPGLPEEAGLAELCPAPCGGR